MTPVKERIPSKFEAWAWSPIIVLRVALVITYLLYIYFGVISMIAGIPIFDLTAPAGYALPWGAALSASAIVSAVGAIDDRYHVVEMWASLALSSFMLAYVGMINWLAFVSGDISRQAVGAAVTIALVLPACRFVYLAAQAGKKKAVIDDRH